MKKIQSDTVKKNGLGGVWHLQSSLQRRSVAWGFLQISDLRVVKRKNLFPAETQIKKLVSQWLCHYTIPSQLLRRFCLQQNTLVPSFLQYVRWVLFLCGLEKYHLVVQFFFLNYRLSKINRIFHMRVRV